MAKRTVPWAVQIKQNNARHSGVIHFVAYQFGKQQKPVGGKTLLGLMIAKQGQTVLPLFERICGSMGPMRCSSMWPHG